MDRLSAMRLNPLGNWTIGDVEAVCREAGVRCVTPRGGGSHYKVSCPGIVEILTIPARRPIKPVYIRSLVRYIDAAIALKSETPRS